MWIVDAVVELGETLLAAWAAADLKTRLREWWWVTTHPELLESGRQVKEGNR